MEKDKTYKIIIEGDTQTLTFTATNAVIKDGFITFTDKEGETFSYNSSRVIYYKEVIN